MILPGPGGGHLDDVLSAYLDDELAPAARHETEAHLAACADCRNELDDVAAARRAIRVMPVHSNPRSLVGATASVTGDPLTQLAPIAVPVRFGP